jgi:hypothetical protein
LRREEAATPSPLIPATAREGESYLTGRHWFLAALSAPAAHDAISVDSNFLLKIGMPAILAFMRTPVRNPPSVEKSDEAIDLPGSALAHFREKGREKILAAERQ